MDNKYIVCFLDLLGYCDLVDSCFTNEEIIKKIEDVFLEFLKVKSEFQARDEIDEVIKANNIIDTHINFRILSDSTLITMPLFNLPVLKDKYDKPYKESLYIETFFSAVSTFILLVSSRLGYFYRGGISIGQYYENTFNNSGNIFLFSKAYIEAVELEKKAKYPRIIINQSSYDYIINLIQENEQDNFLETCFKNDKKENLYYLHIYNYLQNNDFPSRNILLNHIKSAIVFQINNINNNIKNDLEKRKDLKEKYKWLIDYHNNNLPIGLDEYIISFDIYNNIK